MNIALISSPGQYWNLIEYLNHEDISLSTLKLFYFYRPEEKKQYSEYPFFDDFKNTYTCMYQNQNILGRLLWYFNMLYIFAQCFFLRGKNVISGQYWANYHRVLIRALAPLKFISLDDGNANTNPKFQKVFKKIKAKEKIYFTNNNITYSNVIPNDYLYLKKIIANKRVVEGKFFFMGSPYVRDGLMDKQTYNSFTRQIIEKTGTYDNIYVPHRREKLIDLDLDSIKFLNNKGCIEFSLYFLDYIPEEVAGYLSGSLITLKKILPEHCSISSYLPPEKMFKGEVNYLLYKQIVKSYKENDINCFEL